MSARPVPTATLEIPGNNSQTDTAPVYSHAFSNHKGECSMNFRLLALAGVAALPIVLSAPQHAAAACMTDEGYGRYRPCDSFYKAKPEKQAKAKHGNPALT